MWLVADLFERYTTSVAKTFLKIAAMEAEANRRALDNYRARRLAETGLVPAAPLTTKAPIVHPHTGEALTAENAADSPLQVPEAAPLVEAAPVVVERGLRAVPMGVRGDVVARWIETFGAASQAEMAELLEKLRKDKKVRVAELQIIAADVLGEEPAPRKKGDHLQALRQHLVIATQRPRPIAGDAALHA